MRRAAVVLGLLACPSVAAAQMESMHEARGSVGHVHFPTSCSAAAAPLMERGVALLHSFWFEEADRTFRRAAAADTACAMAWWGVASSNLHPLWAAPTPAELAAGSGAVGRARTLGAPTGRERGYVAAIGAYYDSAATLPHAARLRAWEAGLRSLAAAEPADTEAAIFHALALIAIQPKTDTSYADLREAAAILEPLFARMPDHPGLAHYLIHAYDAPPLVSRALHAAQAYARIAPSVPHALHMPSHTYTLLGMWDQSIAANRASLAASERYTREQHLARIVFQGLHAMDYLQYAYLQEGRNAEAAALVRRVAALPPGSSGETGDFAVAAIPARYALERGDWRGAAALAAPAGGTPVVRGVTLFAHAIGAARSGDTAAARTALAAYPALESEAAAGTNPYTPATLRSNRLAATAWLLLASGDTAGAVRSATEAAETEERALKDPLTPGPLLSARELLGDLLVAVGRPADAVAAYRAALASAPRRRRSLAGGIAAARAAGDTSAARGWRAQLASLGGARK